MNFPIIVIGTITIDNIFKHEENIMQYFNNMKSDLKINFVADSYKKYFGGTASNVAYNLSLLNVNSKIIASAGNDFFEFKSFFSNHNINTDWVEEVKNETTSTCVIFCDGNDNHIDVFYPGPMYNDRNLSLYEKNIEGILLAIITPTDVQSMTMRCKECIYFNIPYIFDPGLFLENFDVNDLMFCCKNANILIMNEKEFDRLLKHTNLQFNEALNLYSKVIITKGESGSTLFYNKESMNIPVVKPTRIYDTVGAGDAYKAGLAVGLLNHLPIEECCKIGSTISSFEVESYGSMNHTFTKKIFIERYKENFNEYDSNIESIFFAD